MRMNVSKCVRRSAKNYGLHLLALLAVICTAGYGSAQFSGPAPTQADSPQPLTLSTNVPAPQQTSQVLVLHSGDDIEVAIFGVKDYDVKVRIDNNGSAYLPLIGAVRLEGMTMQQAQRRVGEMLDAAGMIRDPEVTVTVIDSTRDIITVSGEVNAPKAVPAFGELHLLDVIAAAGGMTAHASHTISILRPGVSDPLNVKVGPNLATAGAENLRVYPGDQIIVPRTGVVYVVGAVKLQAAYPFAAETPMTLMQLVSMAGGVNFEAARKDTRIIRTVGTTRQEIPVDLRRVMYGKASDPILQNDDIVFVPTNEFKAGIKGGAAGLALGLIYALPVLPLP